MSEKQLSIKDADGRMKIESNNLNFLFMAYPAGTFEKEDDNGNKTGEKVEYSAGIKVKFGKLQKPMKITAAQALLFVKALEHFEIQEFVRAQYEQEKLDFINL